MLSIVLSNQTNLLEGNQPLVVQKIFRIGRNKSYPVICLRQGGRLIGLKYSKQNHKWEPLWNKPVFARNATYSTNNYPWTVSDNIIPGQSVVAIKNQDGIILYSLKPESLDLQYLNEDGNFHDVYGYELRLGNIYPESNSLGVLARSQRGHVSFYALTPDSLTPDRKDPLFLLDIDLNLEDIWKSKSTDIFVTSLLSGSPDVIVLRSDTGLEFHQFDQNYSLVRLFSTSNGAKPTGQEDDIYFADITSNKYQDMFHLNSSGLYLYSYNNSDYNFVNCHEEFTQEHGWSRRYSNSIVFTDLNGDSFDDLVFTGPKGLNALTFDVNSKKWTTLLDDSSLNGQSVYSNIVGIVKPVVFVQNPSGELLWGNVIHTPTPTTPPPPTEITPTEQPPSETKDCPVSPSMSIGRLRIDTKPVLRWVEQWDSVYLKDALQVMSGKPSFSLPLIDTFSSSGWGMKFDLSYSCSTSATLLGEGWSLPLAQDHIAVEKRGNILEDDLQYQFILQGQSLALELVSNVNGVRKYRSSDRSHDQYNTTFQFFEAEKKWVVEDGSEKAVYGGSDDAIHWSLSWPNWNGPGRDSTQLQPEISAWYLKGRSHKHTGQGLEYSYRQDLSYISSDKKYTSGIWLTSITDGKELRLEVEYGPKNENEFIKHSPRDSKDDVRFPVPLTESNYLRAFNIYTSSYKQNFEFHYDFTNLKRLLSSITQQDETLLNFKYQTASDKQYLENIEVPSIKTKVKFQYVSYKMPNHTFKYPVAEEPKIANGMNYTVLGYRKPKDKEIVLQVLNSEMTQTLHDCKTDLNFSCPGLVTESKSLEIVPYKNTFVVMSKSDSGSVLYVYTRRGGVWGKEPQVYTFNDKANVQFNKKGFVVHMTDANKISLFYNKESDWVQTNRDIEPYTRITYLQSHIVTYDDEAIRIYYTDKESWKVKDLYSIPKKSASAFADLFDWESEIREKVIQNLDINTLQATDNTIALSGISETSGQLASEVNLFLLNPQLEVVKHEIFQINRQNLYDLKQTVDNEKQTLTSVLGYLKDNDKFCIRVKDVYGPYFDDIKDDKQKQKQKDEYIQNSNENKDFRENAKKAVFIDFGFFFNKITSKGMVCNETFIHFTGADWQKEDALPKNVFNLGTKFSLETSHKGQSVKLISQENDKLIKEFNLYSADKFVNAYPLFIAYQEKQNSVEVLSFKDDKTLGPTYTFDKEELHLNNNGRSFITVANVTGSTEKMELRVRPATAFAPSDLEYLVNSTEHSDGELKRYTGYQRKIIVEENPFVIRREFIQIPDNNKDEHGWHKVTHTTRDGNSTKIEEWYDNQGNQVTMPSRDRQHDHYQSNSTSTLLYDRSRRWIISDFIAYKLKDEMVAYYGFEDYETGEINQFDKRWKLNNAEIIKEKFSFTGRNYLQLKNSSEVSFIEGILQPKTQNITYVASCWLRPNLPPDVSTPSPLMKAVITTEKGEEIIGFLAEIKNQIDGWYYLEILLNFETIGEVYKQYATHKQRRFEALPTFRIAIRIEAPSQQTVDLDHVRFSPLQHNFKATVFHPLSGKETEIIRFNGLVTRHFYNRLGEQNAIRNENGGFTLMSYSRTGELQPKPKGVTIRGSKPNILKFNSHTGSQESFDLRNFCNRWNIENPEAWKFSPGQISHVDSNPHTVEANGGFFDPQSSVFRFYFTLIEGYSYINLIWQEVGNIKLYRWADFYSVLTLPDGQEIKPLPSSGEVIIKLDKNYAWIWVNGVLIFDQKFTRDSPNPWSKFSFQVKGHVLLEDIITLNHPSVKVEYVNGFGEKTQIVELENVDSAVVSETLYDEVGRGAIKTKPTRIQRKGGEDLLTYRSNFATNKDPHSSMSVWKTGKLEGEINELNPTDEGFAYSRTKYAPNPLNQQVILGMAGKEFSISGKYSTKVSHSTDIKFINNLFPISHGYHHRVQEFPNGSWRVLVFDKKKNQVAHYMRVSGHDHSLSTYDYDEHNRLIRILPPSYHEKANTAGRVTPWNSGTTNSLGDDAKLQSAWGVHLEYDKKGYLIKKKTPDTNTVHYSYNTANQPTLLTFASDGVNHTVFMKYDERGQIWHTGYINSAQQNSFNMQGTSSEAYQRFYYSYNSVNPLERGRIKQCVTQYGNETVIEKLHFDLNGQIILKNTIASFYIDDEDNFKDFKKEYKGDKVHILAYPMSYKGEPLRVVHTYNKLGQLVGLGKGNSLYSYARFTYRPDGQLGSVEHTPGYAHSYTSRYDYNSPGFIVGVSNPYLTESLTYTEGGYGQEGFGDGMAMRTAFNATWAGSADARWFQVREEDLDKDTPSACIQALKSLGYLTTTGIPIKSFFPASEIRMPLICGGRTAIKLAYLIAKKQQLRFYGHLYAYGNHQELTKAKYFTEESAALISPLQPNTFSNNIANLKEEDSLRIWTSLKDAGFILVDQKRDDTQAAIGKRGSSFLRDQQLREDLNQLNTDFLVYWDPIKRLLTSCLAHRRLLSVQDFVNIFLKWEDVDSSTPIFIYNKAKESANRVGVMLQNKGYFTSNPKELQKILNDKFLNSLSEYTSYTPEIVKILNDHFSHALGESAFDVESYDIDANGNHKLFYNGFDRYNISYRDNSNQIESVQVSHGKTALFMKHDHRGNAVQALHKGIKSIEYHPVSQRTTRIQLTDGSELRFYYDTNGERVLKRCLDQHGNVKHETHYLRDEKGKVLMDKKIIYKNGQRKRTVSAYLYGSKGLLGFIRGDSYYTVISDHMRSVRLVMRDGKVVAAYDYLPYGQTCRIFGEDPEAQVFYRYAGQEWDEETGLYNFHARLYDPVIGRFLQPDPKMQYFSPYKYSGNSPISLHDPDGEFVWFVVIAIFVGVGAFLGGAAANHSFNPLDWNWNSLDTWKGILFGGIEGALIPVSFVGLSPAAIALGLAFNFAKTFVSLAIENHTWDPAKWNWKSPEIYYAIFTSFDLDSGFTKGISGLRQIMKGVKTLKFGKGLKSLLSIGFEVGVLYTQEMMANGNNPEFWEWDLTDPNTYSVFLNGLNKGVGKFKKYAKKINRFKFIRKLHKVESVLDKVIKGGEVVMGLVDDSNEHDFNSIDSYQDYVDGELEDTNTDDETEDLDSSEDPEQDSRSVEENDSAKINTKRLVSKRIRTSDTFVFAPDNILDTELIELEQSEVGIDYMYPDRDTEFLFCQNLNGACFLNAPKDIQPKKMGLIEQAVHTSNFHNATSHINKRDLQHLLKDNKDSTTEFKRETFTTSGSSKPRFWAYQVLETALACLPFIGKHRWKQSDERHLNANGLEAPNAPKYSEYYTGSAHNFEDNSPSVLEMGDTLINNADINGILVWCGVLARKLTGYRPVSPKSSRSYDNNVHYTIRSHQIVEEFIESMSEFLVAVGISSEITDGLVDIKTYNETIGEVRRKLARGKEDEIPKYLFNEVVDKNMSRIALLIAKPNLDLMMRHMCEEMSDLTERLKEENGDWMRTQSRREKLERGGEEINAYENTCEALGFTELFKTDQMLTSQAFKDTKWPILQQD